MADRPDPFDLELMRVARAAVAEARRDVDLEGDLADVRARIAAGDTGQGGATVRPIGTDPSRPRWPVWAAAAAVVAVVGGGAIVALRGDDPDIVRTESPTSLVPASTAPPEPEPETTLPAPAPATTVVDDPAPPSTIADITPTTDPGIDPGPDPGPEPALAIGVRCVGEFSCTSLAATADGRIVAYDPVEETLNVLDPSGATVESVVALAEPLHGWVTDPADVEKVMPFIETVGPDDIVYITAWLGGSDGVRDLLAVPLDGPSAGSAVATWAGAGGVGDSDLVPTVEGLAIVGCCGNDFERPAPDDGVIGWVDRDGGATTFDGTVFRLMLRDAGNDLVRVDGGDTRWFPLPAVASNPRGVPRVVATDDGGALMLVAHQATPHQYLVRFDTDWPEFRIDNADVFFVERPRDIALLEPGGTVVVRDGERFVRRTPGDVGTPGWVGRMDRTTGDEWVVSAPGLNEHIDATSPAWAADPLSLAVQLVPWLGPNETFSASFDESAGVLTITNEGFLDDSVYGTQTSVDLVLGADGLYRIGDGTWTNRCQPGRGHQDYRAELCP